MELWIRSQDKEKLVKVTTLIIAEELKEYFIEDMSNKYCKLSKYATKERALEVLDEIQILLKPKIIYNCNGTINQLYDYTKVYEMPQE